MVYDAYQQTDGFTDFCQYDILQTLSAGVGGAAAASMTAIMLVSGVGMLGMGLQGVALGLYSIGISAGVSTSLFIAGTTTVSWAGMAMAWLFTPMNSRNFGYLSDDLPILKIDSKKMPNIAKNISNAQANGAPQVLTRTENQEIMDANRRTACSGFCGQGSPDEYPFASTYEGGEGAFVTDVPLVEQKIQGGVLIQFYRLNNIKDGDKFRVIVE